MPIIVVVIREKSGWISAWGGNPDLIHDMQTHANKMAGQTNCGHPFRFHQASIFGTNYGMRKSQLWLPVVVAKLPTCCASASSAMHQARPNSSRLASTATTSPKDGSRNARNAILEAMGWDGQHRNNTHHHLVKSASFCLAGLNYQIQNAANIC